MFGVGNGMETHLINEVSRRVDLSQKRIREYEKEGFIKPMRDAKTNNRLYSEFDIAQIRRINILIHNRGFTLACLRNLLLLAPCWNVFGCLEKELCAAFEEPHTALLSGPGTHAHPLPGPLRTLRHLAEQGL